MKKVKSKKLFIGDIIQSDCNKKNFSTFFYSIITVMLHKYYRQKEIVLYIAEDNTEIETIREVTVEVDNSLDFRSLYNEVSLNYKMNKKEEHDSLFSERTMCFLGSNGLYTEKQITKIMDEYDIECGIHINKVSNNVILELYYNLENIVTYKNDYVLDHIEHIFRQCINNEEILLSEINIITPKEQDIIINQFNDTSLDYNKNLFIDGILKNVVAKYENKTAVIFEGEHIKYRELLNQANQIAKTLKRYGVGKNDFVGLIFERGLSMITGIFGVILAGAAYVPIDPTYPDERIEYILNDCNPRVILTNFDFKVSNRTLININEIDYKEGCEIVKDTSISASDLAYCIYTSGTSGNPKGVLVEHGNLINMIKACNILYELTCEDTVMQVANYIFDQSVCDIFNTLSVGATLCIASFNTICTPNKLAEYSNNNNVTILAMTPSLVAQLDENQFKSVRLLDCGGEAANVDVLKRWRKKCKVLNTYGPTETTVNASGYYYEGDERKNIPIGKPLGNLCIYIIQNNSLCGIGVPGELCITGDSVARGYLNLPDLTQEKFIDNPLGKGKMYRTGDMARWLDDGNIEYLGRIDKQVKIRGFRIELGDIESAIRKLKNIQNCAVIAKEHNGEQRIFAYLVSDKKINNQEIRNDLKEVIPSYMIPSYIMQIKEIPVTLSGKLNEKLLPDIGQTSNNNYIAPRNDMEVEINNYYKEVLGIKNIGIKDDFFNCGGDSIKAIQILNRIGKRFECNISIADFFKARTVEKVCELIINTKNSVLDHIPIADERKKYEMSSVQKRLFLIWRMNKESLAYNLPDLIYIKGNIDLEKLNYAFKSMFDRYKILRTAFVLDEKGNMIQHVLKSVEANIEYEENDSDESALASQFIKPFDLEKPPLIRIKLIKRKDGYMMLIDKHHIISDGISDEIFIKELIKFYNGEKLDELRVQYCDYSEWFKERDLSNQKNYWLSVLDGEIPVLNMPEDYKRTTKQSVIGSYETIEFPADIMQDLADFANKNNVTEYMVFLSAIFVLLEKYSRQDDIIIGIPIGNRMHIDTEDMLGMFVNTALIRANPKKEKKFIDFVLEIKEQCLNAYNNQEYPLEELAREINVERTAGRNLFFDVMFAMQNYDRDELAFNDAQAWYGKIPDRKSAMFDLTFNGINLESGFEMNLEYSTDLYKKESAKNILRHLKEIVCEIVKEPEKTIGSINIISEEEKKVIIEKFNQTECYFENDITISKCFEKQVELYADNIAVVDADKKLTFSELNKEANRLARKLRDLEIGKGDFVAMLATRSCEMIVGILAVLKAGGVFVPIDPAYPDERIKYILEDINPRAILVYHAEVETKIPIINLADRSNYEYESENLVEVNRADDLAYCIYTSGTTGKPKGVLVEHTGVLNLKQYFINQHKLSANDRVLKFANYIFDATISELCMSLLVGASLYIVSEEIIGDSFLFQKYIVDNHISIAIIPPVYLAQIELKGLRTVISAGSEVTPDLVKKCMGIPGFSNDYGPTEITVCATYWKHSVNEEIPDRVPIGKPINNKKVYIMQDDNLVGIGIPGELCVGGVGVARGYHKMPDLTKEKFVNNPFDEGKMYRTGDLARWLPDGNIEYLGRIDSQIKIRGFRVELSEIESVLREIDEIEDCAVIVKEKNTLDKTICAYYISENDFDVQKLRDELGRKIPEYMIPSFFMRIEEIPVTRNGKLDKASLPEISSDVADDKLEPQNEVEKALYEIFKEILGVDNISTDDSFFALGGDSIKAIRIVSKMREKGYSLQIKDVINKATIIKIAKVVKKLENITDERKDIVGHVLDTPIIKQFKEWNFKNPHHFNQDLIFEVKTQDKKVVAKILGEMVKHHDMLRGVMKNGELTILESDKMVNYLDEVVIDENKKNLAAEIEKKCTEIQNSFDLEKGPLFKAVLFITSKNNYLYLCCHHLVVDNVSWRIILSDYQMIFEQVMNNEDIILPKKTTSFREWSKALSEYCASEQFQIERNYWEEFPVDTVCALKKGETSEGGNLKEIKIELEESDTKAILTKAVKAYHTEINDLLLASLGMSIYKVSGRKKNVIFLEGHGREKIHKEINIDRTVGWFTIVYPVILNCDDDIEKNIISTKEMLRMIPNHGLGYGLCKDSINEIEQNITFNYLGEIDNENREMFKNADFYTGKCMADEDETENIEINGYVKQGRMVFEITYKDNRYDNNVMEKWSQIIKDTLIDISNFCIQQKTTKKTPSDYVFKGLSWESLNKINDIAENKKLEIENILPPTPLQQGMWFNSITSKDKTTYIIQNVFKLKGDVNEDILEKSLYLLMLRYDVLRSSIVNNEATQPIIVIWKERKIEISFANVENEDEVLNLAKMDLERGFNLEEDSLLRIQILKKDFHNYYMVWTVHHIIVDGWSLPILLGKFAHFYNEVSQGIKMEQLKSNVALESRRSAEFKDYIEWRLEKNTKIGLDYWKGLLKDYDSDAKFVQENNTASNSNENRTVEQKIIVPEELREDLTKVSNKVQVTLNSIVEAAFGVLLQKSCCLSDVVFGKVVSGRNADIEGINDMAGLCINTIPVRVSCDVNTTVRDLLGSVQKQSLDSSEYDYCALSEIQKQSKNGANLVHTVVAFENYYVSKDNMEMIMQDVDIELISSRDQNEFSLSFFTLLEADGKMAFEIIYNSEKYSKEYVDKILSQMLYILEKFVENIDIKIINLQKLVQIGKESALNNISKEMSNNKPIKITRRKR